MKSGVWEEADQMHVLSLGPQKHKRAEPSRSDIKEPGTECENGLLAKTGLVRGRLLLHSALLFLQHYLL